MASLDARRLLASVAMLACTGLPSSATNQGTPPAGLDVNDVSVLFPLPATAGEKAQLLGADAVLADGTQLWPAGVFDSALAAAQALEFPLSTGATRIDFPAPLRDRPAWRVVSFRFDPEARLAEAEPGMAQIRLVLQPITPPAQFQPGIDADFTAHLIYSFPEAESAKRLARALLDLKAPGTTGKPLGVHPVMKSEGLTGPTATAYKRFLTTELSAQRLRFMALMGLAPSPEPWIFVSAVIDPDAQTATIVPQRFGADQHPGQALNFQSGGSVEPTFPGVSTAGLVNTSRTELDGDGARAIAVVGNPEMSVLLPRSPDSKRHRDCVSCHSATSALVRLTNRGADRGALALFLDHPSRFPTPPGVTGYADPDAIRDFTQIAHGLPWSVRNFGFFEGQPALTMRTVNETARVAKQANQLLGVQDPFTLACNERAVWACTLRFGTECVSENCGEGAQ